jgi:hypothetical protein
MGKWKYETEIKKEKGNKEPNWASLPAHSPYQPTGARQPHTAPAHLCLNSRTWAYVADDRAQSPVSLSATHPPTRATLCVSPSSGAH